MKLLFLMVIFNICSADVKTVASEPQKSLMGDSVKAKTEEMAARLLRLRALMAAHKPRVAAYIVPTSDAHNSEYISPADARREWLTGFTGSAGTAIVTHKAAAVWTDGRYYTQFEKEAPPPWTLMKQSLPETPSMEKWLASSLSKGDIVALDPTTMRRADWTPLQSAMKKAGMELLPIKLNLVDEARTDMKQPPPARPMRPLTVLPVKYTGKTSGEKVKELREKIKEKKAAALILTALDEIAYTLNLRGSDINYNPIFFSYLIIKPSSIVFFWKDGTLADDVKKHLVSEGLENVEVRGYGEVLQYLEAMAEELYSAPDSSRKTLWLSHDSSEAVHSAAAGENFLKEPLEVISEVSPVALAKMIKNDVELQGFRECHIRDGVAVVRFFNWLHSQIAANVTVTEIEASDKLLEFRQQEEDFMGPSFETISSAGANGAVIHYSPDRDGQQYAITSDVMYLLDSGGQYKDGTTDITRTRHMSRPTPAQIDSFTRVLKGQISLGSALFPKGVKGNVLDTLARKSLWDVGLDYAHGTGHGVGHFLNVHEGPQGVSWRPYPDDPGLSAGAVLSNEPGYYEVGEYGIRHEDLVEVVNVTRDSEHPRAANLFGDFNSRGVLGFKTLTLVPHQRRCIDARMLDDFELNYLNAYHERVWQTLSPILKTRGLTADLDWLRRECDPIVRDLVKE